MNMSIVHRLTRIVPWITLDALIIVIAYLIIISVRALANPIEYENGFILIGIAVLVTVVSLYYSHAYHRVWRQTSGYSVISLIGAVTAATIGVGVLNLIAYSLPFSVILSAHLLVLIGIVAIRYRSRLITGLDWRLRAVLFQEFPNDPAIRVLIVGAGEAGQILAWRLRYRVKLDRNYKVIGFIDDDPQKWALYIEGVPVFGDRHHIPEITTRHRIDLIVVAIHNIEGHAFRDILSYCEQTSATIKVVPDTLALLNGKTKPLPIRDVEPEDLIGRTTRERYSAVDLSPVTNKRVLITGCAGSIGSELTQQMVSYDPTQLIMVDNNESALHDLYISLCAAHPHLNIKPVLTDVTEYDELKKVFGDYQPEVVFHAAAYKHVPILEIYPQQALRVNVGGTLNLAKLAYEFNVDRFVLISTDKAVNPSSVMGASKRLCEYIVHSYANYGSHDTRYTVVRFGNVLGSRGSVVPTFNHQLDMGGPITVTHPDMTRYFMSIAEAVNLVIHAACLTNHDEIFLLRMGETVRILDIAERMIRLRGLRPYQDVKIEFTGIRPGEKLHEELHDEVEKPTETEHPHIFKLNGWKNNNIVPERFLHELEHLVKNGFDPLCDPLDMLVKMTLFNYYVPQSGDLNGKSRR